MSDHTGEFWSEIQCVFCLPLNKVTSRVILHHRQTKDTKAEQGQAADRPRAPNTAHALSFLMCAGPPHTCWPSETHVHKKPHTHTMPEVTWCRTLRVLKTKWPAEGTGVCFLEMRQEADFKREFLVFCFCVSSS